MKPRRDAAATLSFNAAYILLALGWVWFIAVLGIEWGDNLQKLNKTLREARHLTSTFCNTTLGAQLAGEFARCGDAAIMVKNPNLWFKTMEKTIRSLAVRAISFTGEVSLAALANVAAVALAAATVGVLCNSLTKIVNGGRAEMEYSPMAQARLNKCVDFVDMGKDYLHLE